MEVRAKVHDCDEELGFLSLPLSLRAFLPLPSPTTPLPSRRIISTTKRGAQDGAPCAANLHPRAPFSSLDVDREFVLLFAQFDENIAHSAVTNFATSTGLEAKDALDDPPAFDMACQPCEPSADAASPSDAAFSEPADGTANLQRCKSVVLLARHSHPTGR